MSQPASKPSQLSRRTLFAGAGAVAAIASVARLVPAEADTAEAPPSKPAPERGGGYSLTEHVKRYYKTTLL